MQYFFRKDCTPLQILTTYYLLLYVLDLHKVKVLDIYGQGLQCHDQSVNLITDMQCCHQSHCGRFCWLLSWNWKCNSTDALYKLLYNLCTTQTIEQTTAQTTAQTTTKTTNRATTQTVVQPTTQINVQTTGNYYINYIPHKLHTTQTTI